MQEEHSDRVDSDGGKSTDSPNTSKRALLHLATALTAVGVAVTGAVIGWYLTQEFLPRSLEQRRPAVTADVLTDPASFFETPEDWTGYSYIVDTDTVGPTPTNHCNEMHSWAHSRGGIDGESSHVIVVLRGNRQVEVTLDKVGVEIVREDRPRDGIHVYCAPKGGPDTFPFGVLLDLDTEEVVPHPTNETMLPRTMAFGEVEYLRVEALAPDGYYEWRLLLHFTDGGTSGWIQVDNNGEPFKTTSGHHLPKVYWHSDGWEQWDF